RVQCQQHDIRQHDQTAESNAEFRLMQPPDKGKGLECVTPQKQNEDNCQIQKVAVNILQNERKGGFTFVVAFAAFINSAGRWIEKKSAVVGFAIVVAGGSKSQRSRQN